MDKFISTRHTIDQGSPLAPQVYCILKQGIVQAEFLPGDRASEVEIARQLEVSRQPVREAFLRLRDEGLLNIRPQRGTFVQKISVKAVMDARFVREAIEADIVRLLASKFDSSLVAELRCQLQAQRKVIKSDPVSFMKLDDLFHRTLAEAADKSYAWSVVEGLKTQMDRVRFLSFNHFHIEQLIVQHTAIVDAIATSSASIAVKHLRYHLSEILKSLPHIAQEHPGFFNHTDNLFNQANDAFAISSTQVSSDKT